MCNIELFLNPGVLLRNTISQIINEIHAKNVAYSWHVLGHP